MCHAESFERIGNGTFSTPVDETHVPRESLKDPRGGEELR